MQYNETAALAFFMEHGSWSHNPATETPEAGRQRCAEASVKAERWAMENGYRIERENDFEVDHVKEFPDAYDKEPETCEHFALVAPDGVVVASLGCVDDASPEYARVVSAELAAEAMAGEPERKRNAAVVEYVTKAVPIAHDAMAADTTGKFTTCPGCGEPITVTLAASIHPTFNITADGEVIGVYPTWHVTESSFVTECGGRSAEQNTAGRCQGYATDLDVAKAHQAAVEAVANYYWPVLFIDAG